MEGGEGTSGEKGVRVYQAEEDEGSGVGFYQAEVEGGGGAEEREARTPLYWASREHGPHDMNTRTTLPNPNPPTPLTFCWATPHLLAVT